MKKSESIRSAKTDAGPLNTRENFEPPQNVEKKELPKSPPKSP